MLNEKFIRVLYMDLATEKVRVEEREDLTSYLGGVGVASKLLQENLNPDLPPESPEHPVVFAIGAGAYVFPVLTKTVAMFVSPLTGELGESYAGSRIAMAMLMAGYDALVILGKAKRHSYLAISCTDASVKDARAMWGLSVSEAARNIRDREHAGGRSAGKRSIMIVGPAGENGVAYSCVTVDSYRHFGRLGLGACLGAKNIKGISIYGHRSIPVLNPSKYLKVYQKLYKKCTATDMMAKYHDAGTPINIKPLNQAGGLPSYNMRDNRFEDADKISGEAFAQNNLVRKIACTGCPVGCIHIGMYRREFDKGHEYEAISVSYDYELIFALGTFLGINETDKILALIDEVEEAGLDAMSTGVCLGWATEALEKGFITKEDTLVDLKFGEVEGYAKAINYLSEGKNRFYKSLGRGVRHAASKYGGEDFAMHIAGNEMAGYHTGYGALIGSAVGMRHSHLDNGGYSVDQSMKEFNEDILVEKIYDEEMERCMTNSLVMCLFARKIYDRETIVEALNTIGWNLKEEDLRLIGKRVFQMKLQIKKALGFNQMSVKFPKRFFETPSMMGELEEETAYRIMRKFTDKTDELLREKLD